MTMAVEINNAMTIKGGNEVLTAPVVKYTGKDIIDIYLDTLNSISTQKQYKKAIYEFFLSECEVSTIEELTLQNMQMDSIEVKAYEKKWRDKYKNKEIKASTFNAKMKGVRRFYDWLVIETTSNKYDIQMLKVNPFANVKLITENDSDGSSPLTAEEILLMINNPYGYDRHIRERNLLLFELGITTGIRKNALISITMDNIQKIDGNWLIVTTDKNDKESLKPINNYYERLVNWYEIDKKTRRKNNGTIFNICESNANDIIREWAKSVGIDKKVTFHSLRTTTGVQIFHNSDDNLFNAQDFLQHDDVKTTRHYTKKEIKVNHAGENIMQNIKTIDRFESAIQQMSKEELVKMLSQLDINKKIDLLRIIEGN